MGNEPHEYNLNNEQIVEYLRFYLSIETPPQYAVLLNGEWGSGKTWFIEQFRKTIENETKTEFLYVSLYGVTSTSEIEDLFFQQLHPLLSSKLFTVGTKILRDTLKASLKINLDALEDGSTDISAEMPSVDLKSILGKARNKILIFDDLERCKMKPEEILGYINTFVEHHGQKVIILAYEKEIDASEEFKKKNEKLIGRRFTLNVEFDQGFQAFLEKLKDHEVKKVLADNALLIKDIYIKAECKNLRTLRHSIIEYTKLFSSLPVNAKEHPEFQSECIKTVFNICIEIKNGRVLTKDLRHIKSMYSLLRSDRTNSNWSTSKKEEPESEDDRELKKSLERIFDNSMTELIPNEELLYCFFEFGSVPKEVLNNAIESCRFFFNESTPAWMRLWRIWDLEEHEFKTNFDLVFKDFTTYKYVKQSELKHVAGILLFLSRNGLIQTTLKSMKVIIHNTVSHMNQNNLIQVMEPKELSNFRFDNSYMGLGYTDEKTTEFQDVCSLIKAYQSRRTEEAISKRADELTELMIKDSKQFFNELTISDSNPLHLYQFPVLRNISVVSFLDSYIAMKAIDRIDILQTLNERYKNISHCNLLTQELPWLKKLRDEINKRIKSLNQPTRFHVKGLEVNAVSPAIQVIVTYQKQKKTST